MSKPAKLLTYEGQTLTIREWGVVRGISHYTIRSRLAANMPIHDVLAKCNHRHRGKRNKPRVHKPTVQKTRAQTRAQMRQDRAPWTLDAPRPSTGHRSFLTVDGVTRSYAEWSVLKSISVAVITRRVKDGRSPERALLPYVMRVAKPKPRRTATIHTRMTSLTVDGETRTVERWAYELCIPVAEVLTMLKAGEQVEGYIAQRVAARRAQKPAPQDRPRTKGLMHVPTLAEVDAMRRAA